MQNATSEDGGWGQSKGGVMIRAKSEAERHADEPSREQRSEACKWMGDERRETARKRKFEFGQKCNKQYIPSIFKILLANVAM